MSWLSGEKSYEKGGPNAQSVSTPHRLAKPDAGRPMGTRDKQIEYLVIDQAARFVDYEDLVDRRVDGSSHLWVQSRCVQSLDGGL